MRNKTAIIGTVGIPAKYGGFETLVEYLTKHIGKDLDVTVFCSGKTYKKKLTRYNNARLKYINLNANGMQSILYDTLSLFRAARTANVILVLGISGCIFLPLFRIFYPRKKLVINIDGLEHRREKWSACVQKFLKLSEKFAVKFGNVIISDNKAIQKYVNTEYGRNSELIAYGGDHAVSQNLTDSIVKKYQLPKKYAFKVCRIEPENNIHLILEAFETASLPIVIVGNWTKSQYGRELKEQYKTCSSTLLLDPIYEQDILNQIRSNCAVYVHGHSAGGTNPSLVEAMSLALPVIAFDVFYNRETTNGKALYFSSSSQLREVIAQLTGDLLKQLSVEMESIATTNYAWQKIASKYFKLLV